MAVIKRTTSRHLLCPTLVSCWSIDLSSFITEPKKFAIFIFTSRHTVKRSNFTLSLNYLSYLSSFDRKLQMSLSLSQSMHDFLGILQRSFTQVEIVDLKKIKLLILLGHHSYNDLAGCYEFRTRRYCPKEYGFPPFLVINKVSISSI